MFKRGEGKQVPNRKRILECLCFDISWWHDVNVFPLFSSSSFPKVPSPRVISPYKVAFIIKLYNQQLGYFQVFLLHCSFVEYGVMLEINDLQYLPDGRSFLDCVGGRRFKVKRVVQ